MVSSANDMRVIVVVATKLKTWLKNPMSLGCWEVGSKMEPNRPSESLMDLIWSLNLLRLFWGEGKAYVKLVK